MPRYEFACCRHFELVRPMSEASFPAICPDCGEPAQRIFTVPQFTEDRRRLWRNREGTRYHHQIGGERPESRKEEEALLKARGQEMVPWNETPPHFQRAREYGDYLAAGGEALPPDEVAAIVNEPKEPEPTIAEQLDAIGYNRDRAFSRTDHAEIPVV